MAIFRWGHAFDAFRDLEREVDRLMRTLTLEGFRVGRVFPAVNIYDLEDEFLLTAQLPGVSADDLELSVAGGVLTISGRRGQADAIPEERYRRTERPAGTWERSFHLPDKVLDDEMTANLSNGILTLHFPKAPTTEPRQIPVKVNDA
jgi:HSP20 family protein